MFLCALVALPACVGHLLLHQPNELNLVARAVGPGACALLGGLLLGLFYFSGMALAALIQWAPRIATDAEGLSVAHGSRTRAHVWADVGAIVSGPWYLPIYVIVMLDGSMVRFCGACYNKADSEALWSLVIDRSHLVLARRGWVSQAATRADLRLHTGFRYHLVKGPE
jgi:hypothetical protein